MYSGDPNSFPFLKKCLENIDPKIVSDFKSTCENKNNCRFNLLKYVNTTFNIKECGFENP